MSRLSFQELKLNYNVNRAFDYSSRIKQYKEWIKQSRDYSEKLKYDSWIAAAEIQVINAANDIINTLEKGISNHV